MSVEQTNTIDFISTSNKNIVVLTLSDHLNWTVENHLELLEAKLYSYIEVLDTENIYELYPDSVGKEFEVQIVFKYKPNKDGEIFLNSVSNIFEDLPYKFSYYQIDQ